MKTKLDRYDLSILVKGLYSMRDRYNAETSNQIDELLLRLINIFEKMDPDRKAKIAFNNTEHLIILHNIIDWRNQLLQEGKTDAAEYVGELILIVSK